MALLALIVVKAPGWLDGFLTRVLSAAGEQQKEALSRFQATLAELRADTDRTLDRLEKGFVVRNEALKQELELQTRQLTVQLEEILRVLSDRPHRSGRSKRPPGSGESSSP